MKNINPIYIYIFIITLPIIDLLTTFTIELPLSFGAIVRSLFLVIMFVWLLWESSHLNRMVFTLVILPFALLLASFGLHWMTKDPFLWMEELQFYMKTAYYVTIVLFVYLYREIQDIDIRSLLRVMQIAALITASSYWIAIGTGTSFMSYPYDKSGFSGWFFAANELSTIVLILLTFTFVAFFYKQTWFSFVVVIATLSLTPMIGTKTAFFGSAIIIVTIIAGSVLTLQRKKIFPSLILGLIFLISLPNTPALENTNLVQVETNQINESIENTATMNTLLSSRDMYLEETQRAYIASSLTNKLFGLGYAGSYDLHPKTIEMDFYDLFFSFGIIGTIILLYPLVIVTLRSIRNIQMTTTYLLLFSTYILCLGIAFYVGHVIFAPAVMSYIGIILLTLNLNKREEKLND